MVKLFFRILHIGIYEIGCLLGDIDDLVPHALELFGKLLRVLHNSAELFKRRLSFFKHICGCNALLAL